MFSNFINVQKVIIGSRGSELALWQANFVLKKLKKIGLSAEIKVIKTKGDAFHNLSWDKMEGKGFFTKEIEDALLNNEIDLAVHSHKDLPTEEVKGLVIAAVSEREDPSELLLIHKNAVDKAQRFFLKKNAVVGTSSARRKSQLLAWRSDLQLQDLRGNIPTRIQKLKDKKYDAILIAYAGAKRLKIDLHEFHCEKLDPSEFIPAPAQGVLALQIRKRDKELFKKLQKINSKETRELVSIERKVMNLFQGGCQLPLGVFCKNEKSMFKISIAKADKWDTFPGYFYFESKKTKGLAEKIVRHIKNRKPCSVFISRDEKPDDFFNNCLVANGYKVFSQSLIEIKPLSVKNFPKTDWIFFSSKNAVIHSPAINGGYKIGVLGKATAEEARRRGWKIDFTGDLNDTRMIAKKFASAVGEKTVLFPQAKESLRTVQQFLKKEQVVDVPVYETISNSKFEFQSLEFDIFVFTSPSNVAAFFQKNKIGAGQRVIAMGERTASELKKYQVKVNAKPVSFDDLGLVQAVMSL